MLVAKKEEYYYGDYEINQKKKAVNQKKKNMKKNMKNKLNLVVSAFIILVVCLSVLVGYAHITEMRLEITKLDNQKVELEKEKQELLAKLDSLKNSDKIEEDARLKLGMVYPTEDQIVYVDVNEEIFDEKSSEVKDVAFIDYFKNVLNIVSK